MNVVRLSFRKHEFDDVTPVFDKLGLRYFRIPSTRAEWAVIVPVLLETRDDGILAFSPKVAHLHVYKQSCDDRALFAYGTAFRNHLRGLVKKHKQAAQAALA